MSSLLTSCLQLALIYRGSSRVEDAAELYVKAGNSFKMAKKWSGMCHLTVKVYVV